MTYTISEVWKKGEEESTVVWFTKYYFATSEAGIALQNLGFELKGREVFPDPGKAAVIKNDFKEMEIRQKRITER